MKLVFLVLAAAAWLLAAGPAAPHHAFSSEFDINRPVRLTGTVTRMQWTNPHAWIYIDAQDDNGNVESWAIELVGINFLLRRGWTRDKIKAGDILDVQGFGARDGSNTGNASSVSLANTGELLWDSVRAEDD